MDQAEKLRELVTAKRQSEPDAANNGDENQDPKGNENKIHHSKSSTKVIAVSSGKGGVGKSNFTVNLAIELSKLGNRVMIFDADLGLANVDIIFGINPRYNLTHVIREERSIKDIITETEYGVKLIASGSGVKELANLSNVQREKFITQLAEVEDMVDILLIDTGAGISKNTLSFIYASDYGIVITTPEPTALMDAYGLIKVVSLSKEAVPLKLIVNMANSKEEAKEIASRVILLSRRFLNTFVESYGFIYRDKAVLNSVMSQKPFSVLHPDSRAANCVKEIAERISDRFVKERGGEKKPNNITEAFKKVFDIFR
ncbi:MAG: MinD/ParA family protein [Candidatus Goldbacteria bacterium]|nr:MinD/ParA family protein [Candidatus Goldiibacteriota bacterium]